MSPRHKSAENLVEMNLCPSGLRVFRIEPIENENLHTRSSGIRRSPACTARPRRHLRTQGIRDRCTVRPNAPLLESKPWVGFHSKQINSAAAIPKNSAVEQSQALHAPIVQGDFPAVRPAHPLGRPTPSLGDADTASVTPKSSAWPRPRRGRPKPYSPALPRPTGSGSGAPTPSPASGRFAGPPLLAAPPDFFNSLLDSRTDPSCEVRFARARVLCCPLPAKREPRPDRRCRS